jgi:putative endonuclease
MFSIFKKLTFGGEGEAIAVKYLRKKGYEILERNYRTKLGEIDIIVRLNDCIVFVEVKRRGSGRFGKGYEAVDKCKQRQIINTANYYLKKYGIKTLCRFDVISIDGEEVTHIENAFLAG